MVEVGRRAFDAWGGREQSRILLAEIPERAWSIRGEMERFDGRESQKHTLVVGGGRAMGGGRGDDF